MLGTLGRHDGRRERGLEMRVALVALGAGQVACKEAQVVEREHAAVQLLLLLRQDAGDLLRKLDELPQVGQLLTDPRHAGRERAGAGHGAAQLAF